LRPLQDFFKPEENPSLLVGIDSPDDAAVWKLDERRALVVTTDFFTPIVDNPYDYGAIAAANSLSDVYAMGGQPFLALNIAALPPDLPPEIAGEIFRGAAEICKKAGVVIAGGHSIQDKEPKFGLVALGFVDQNRMVTKGGVKVGDILVISKPLGFGVTTTALKQDRSDPTDISEVVGWMKRLNHQASFLAVQHEVSGGTDVTGYSLLGHAWEMARASGVRLKFNFSRIPFTRGAFRYAQEWTFPGGASDNRVHCGEYVSFAEGIDEASQMLLFDPQTSGGLLLAVPPDKMTSLMEKAAEVGQPLWIIGESEEGEGIEVYIE
jgi:selenide, water dikinase